MRIFFNDASRPKKAASLISQFFGFKLMKCQEEIAKSAGYRDWHDLAVECSRIQERSEPIREDQSYSVAQQIEVISILAERLSCNAGDLFYFLSRSRFFGTAQCSQSDVLDLRISLFEKFELPRANKKQPGAVGRFKPHGKNAGEAVILREYGKPTRVVTNKSADAVVADFEFLSPRESLPLFIPMRLYIPYGKWIEPEGSEVWFSRDYFPLWRFKAGKQPERLEPWQWIRHNDEKWFFKEGDMPWYKPATHDIALKMLENAGVRGLPRLVEVLPSIIQDKKLANFGDAVEQLKPKSVAAL